MQQIGVFPVLETRRLILRQPEPNDAAVILRLRSESEMLKYIEMYRLQSLDEAREMIETNHKKFAEGKGLIWGIQFKNQRNLIGYLGYHTIVPEHFRAEVCYLLLPEFWNLGITKEAMRCITPFAFTELNLHRLESVIMKGNNSSVQIALHAGYRKEAHLRQHIFFEGRFYDYLVYAMIRKDYEKLPLQSKTVKK